jgi:hypothetical protein
MFSQSIRRKIVGIALGLVVLMIAASILSTLIANRVGHLLDELTNKYLPVYGDLARARAIARGCPRPASDGYRQDANAAG